MNRIRILTALILALLWVPSAGHCLLAATFPEVFGVTCCECDGHATDGSEAPVDEGTCNQCVTLETGVNLGALVPVAVPSPAFWEEDAFAQWLRRSLELAAMEVAEVPESVPVWSPPPTRTVTLTKALPVRGPSISA
ncbi:MAG: hypothetical protein ABIP85_19215 [Chthoniobacteraceae bacterium]